MSIMGPPDLWRLKRDARRRRRARYATRERTARKLREAGHPLLEGLSDADVLRAVEAGVKALRAGPYPFGSRLWQRHAAGKRGARALARRVAGVGYTMNTYMSLLAQRSHGQAVALPFYDPPRRPARTAAGVASAPQHALLRDGERPRTMAWVPRDPPPTSVPGKPWLLGDWRPRR